MDYKYYDKMLDEFKLYWAFKADQVVDYRPRGERGLRIKMKDGSEYDYDSITHGLRVVRNYGPEAVSDITDERCRNSFVYRLTDLMNARGFTQQSLSEYTGISKGAINKYLNKQATPSMTAFRKIAYALQCTMDELLD